MGMDILWACTLKLLPRPSARPLENEDPKCFSVGPCVPESRALFSGAGGKGSWNTFNTHL